jgi:hypothetical protein
MTDTTIAQVDVLAKLDEERAWWEGILADVGEERMDQVGVTDKWAFKDVITHLSGWQRRTIDRLAADAQGLPKPPTPWPAEFNEIEDEDEAVERVNNWIFDRSHNRSVADILAESRGQWDELRSLVAGLSDDVLNDPNRFSNLEGHSLADSISTGYLFEHFHEEHEPMINDWIAMLQG